MPFKKVKGSVDRLRGQYIKACGAAAHFHCIFQNCMNLSISNLVMNRNMLIKSQMDRISCLGNRDNGRVGLFVRNDFAVYFTTMAKRQYLAVSNHLDKVTFSYLLAIYDLFFTV